jgi:hypothetical protein
MKILLVDINLQKRGLILLKLSCTTPHASCYDNHINVIVTCAANSWSKDQLL